MASKTDASGGALTQGTKREYSAIPLDHLSGQRSSAGDPESDRTRTSRGWRTRRPCISRKLTKAGWVVIKIKVMRIPLESFTVLCLASVIGASVNGALAPALVAQSAGVTPDMVQTGTDIPAKWEEPHPGYDYEKRDVMIPMRDGVKLHTVILVPKGAKGCRYCWSARPTKRTALTQDKPKMRDAVWSAQREWVDDGYIIVGQDIRGKYGSEGDYVMTRPPMGPLNPTKTDDTTDAWDTIDWLVKNVPESNGRVGMIGSSYDGWTVTMALLGPHPALKVAAPESPMIDGWMGDDWFHYGAFRQVNLDYFTGADREAGRGHRGATAGRRRLCRIFLKRGRRAIGPK